MPRNGSGTATIINTFVPGTTADANQVNANFTDVASMLTDSLPRDGQAGMIGQFLAASGTIDKPGVSFNGDTNTGWRRVTADTIALVCGGVDIVTFSSTGVVINTGGISGASNLVQPGMAMIWHSQTVPTGWRECDGAALLIATYPTLATNIYVGDVLNPTAAWGYKCTDPLNPNTTRSLVGTYIVIPDYRGEFIRGWDHGRSVDVGRAWASLQAEMIGPHTHPITDPGHTHPGVPQSGADVDRGSLASQFSIDVSGNTGSATTGITVNNNSGTENRPRNAAPMYIIKL